MWRGGAFDFAKLSHGDGLVDAVFRAKPTVSAAVEIDLPVPGLY